MGRRFGAPSLAESRNTGHGGSGDHKAASSGHRSIAPTSETHCTGHHSDGTSSGNTQAREMVCYMAHPLTRNLSHPFGGCGASAIKRAHGKSSLCDKMFTLHPEQFVPSAIINIGRFGDTPPYLRLSVEKPYMTNDPTDTYPPSFWAAPRPQDQGRLYYQKHLIPHFLKRGLWPNGPTEEDAKLEWSKTLSKMSRGCFTANEFYEDMKRWEIDRKWVWRTRLQRPLAQWLIPHFRCHGYFPGKLPLEIWAKILNETQHHLDRHDFTEEIVRWVQREI